MKKAIAAVVLAVALTTAADAQGLVAFGDRTPCHDWLAMPSGNIEQGRQIASWVLGFWSGMNIAAQMHNEVADTGHTMQNKDALQAVWTACRAKPDTYIGPAAAIAWAQTRAQHR